jgi:uncharacterized protein
MNTEQALPEQDESLQRTEQTVPTAELKPIAPSKRIDAMDILRGFALIGIILMNIEWFGRTITELGRFDFTATGGDWGAGWFIRLFVEGKFYKLFSILFGMGFAIMLIRAKEAGRPFGAWFTRRMVALFIFGMAHLVFFWGGDILHDYAAGGLLLLGWVYIVRFKWMQRFDSPRSFLRLGLTMLSLPIVFSLGAALFFGATRTQDVMTDAFDQRTAVIAMAETIQKDPVRSAKLIADAEADKTSTVEKEKVDEDAMTPEELVAYKAEKRFLSLNRRADRKAKEIEAYSQDSFWTATVYRAEESLDALKDTPFFAAIISFPLFLVGFWFVASGVMREPQKHINMFKGMTWVGISIGLFTSAGALLVMTHPATEKAIELRAVSQTFFMFGQYAMTAGYIGAMVLITLTARGARWFSWLAPMGRMALTNYIMHSAILSGIFFGYGAGLYGQILRLEQVGLVAVIILGQAVLSTWWLKQFQFGPLEWLWRSMTYLKMQPMRLENKVLVSHVEPITVS